MMDVHSLSLSQRTVTGKKVKQLRRQGILPVHMYGSGIDAQSLQGTAGELRRLLPQVGTNVPVSVEVEGSDQENICFVREVQRHPRNRRPAAYRLHARGCYADHQRGSAHHARGQRARYSARRHVAAIAHQPARRGAADGHTCVRRGGHQRLG